MRLKRKNSCLFCWWGFFFLIHITSFAQFQTPNYASEPRSRSNNNSTHNDVIVVWKTLKNVSMYRQQYLFVYLHIHDVALRYKCLHIYHFFPKSWKGVHQILWLPRRTNTFDLQFSQHTSYSAHHIIFKTSVNGDYIFKKYIYLDLLLFFFFFAVILKITRLLKRSIYRTLAVDKQNGHWHVTVRDP